MVKQLRLEAATWGEILWTNGRLEGDELVMKVNAVHFAQEWAIKAYDQSKELSITDLLAE